MAKSIEYLDVDREDYEMRWVRDYIDEQLKNYQIISIETLENTIRFWYNKEE